MKRITLTFVLSSVFISSSHAACIPCCNAPAWLGIEAIIFGALYDPTSVDIFGTPVPIVRVLRQMQATDSMNTTKLRETIENSDEQKRNGAIAYKQQEQQLIMSRNALDAFPDVTQSACDEWVLRNSTQKDLTNQIVLAQKSSSKGAEDAHREWKDSIKEAKDFFSSDPANLSGGTISHPGCEPVFDPSVTAFETKKPVPVGWNCGDVNKTSSSRTIPKDRMASAQILLNQMIQPEPLPPLPVGSRKTPAGQVYEVMSTKYREQVSFIRDSAQHVLSEYMPVVDMQKMKDVYKIYGLEAPKDAYISPMDDMHARASMRFDNTHFKEESFKMPTKDVLLAYHQSQIGKLNMTFKMFEREHHAFRSRVTALAGIDSVEFDARN